MRADECPFLGESCHAADITAKTDFDPEPTLPGLKSRSAAVSRCTDVCYPFGRKKAPTALAWTDQKPFKVWPKTCVACRRGDPEETS
jgi:hypothetical protein